jgi:hypothetical protein
VIKDLGSQNGNEDESPINFDDIILDEARMATLSKQQIAII